MKYENLFLYLNSSGLDSVTLSFAELESVLGFSLPHSASTYSAWWANGGHSQAHAWMNAGYCVDEISLKDRHVVFKKVPDVPADRTGIAESGRAGRIEKTEEQVRRVPADKTVNAESGRTEKTVKTERHVQTAGGRIPAGEEMQVCGYAFRFLQEIIPECDENGKLIDYCPQGDYHGKDKKGLNKNGDGAFCHFSIHADDCGCIPLGCRRRDHIHRRNRKTPAEVQQRLRRDSSRELLRRRSVHQLQDEQGGQNAVPGREACAAVLFSDE